MTTITETSTLADFRAFYAEIPDEKWCVGKFEFDGKHCARGFVGERGDECCCEHDFTQTPQSTRLGLLINKRKLAIVNDGCDSDYQQKTPKARVLAFLDDLIAKEKGTPC